MLYSFIFSRQTAIFGTVMGFLRTHNKIDSPPVRQKKTQNYTIIWAVRASKSSKQNHSHEIDTGRTANATKKSYSAKKFSNRKLVCSTMKREGEGGRGEKCEI